MNDLVEIREHRLIGVNRCDSPNYDDRPPCVIDTVVVHNISLPPGEFGGCFIDALFTNTLDPSLHPYFNEISGLQVSAHLLIDRKGRVTQFVPFDKRAWHAGQSSYQGRQRFNDFSIGIELEGTDHLPYEAAQYQRLAGVLLLLHKYYPAISKSNIVGHSTIAPLRKTDPGPAFDWGHLHSLIAALDVSA